MANIVAKNIFKKCIHIIAEIYSKEENLNGHVTGQFLKEIDFTSINLQETESSIEFSNIFNSYSTNDEHELVRELKKISHFLPWYQSDMEGRIDAKLKKQMLITELVGPHSIIKSDDYEVGIFLQFPNVFYPARRHAAEETFYTLAGKSFWQLEDKSEIERCIGEYIHHPSMKSHSNRTTDLHLVACWRWSGDISTESYAKFK